MTSIREYAGRTGGWASELELKPGEAWPQPRGIRAFEVGDTARRGEADASAAVAEPKSSPIWW